MKDKAINQTNRPPVKIDQQKLLAKILSNHRETQMIVRNVNGKVGSSSKV